MPRKTPETRNLTAKSRWASFGHVGTHGGKVRRPMSSKTRLVLLCVRGTFRKLLALNVVELISYSQCLMASWAWMTMRRPPKQRRKRSPRQHQRENQQHRGMNHWANATLRRRNLACPLAGHQKGLHGHPRHLTSWLDIVPQHWHKMERASRFRIWIWHKLYHKPWIDTDPTKCRLQLLKERLRAWPQCWS